MNDLYFSLTFFLTNGFIGLTLARLMPVEHFPARALSAPIFGFIVVGVLAAVVYRHDGSLQSFMWLAAFVAGGCAVHEIYRILPIQSATIKTTSFTIGTAFLVLLLCIAPKWTGGARFAAFQGNRYDHLNYMTQMASYRSLTYGALSALDANQPILQRGKFSLKMPHGNYQVAARPAPQIVAAGFAKILGLDTIQATYPYLASLQTLTFFGLAFLIAQLFRPHLGVTLFCAAAGTVGFPMQYIFDINAWGKLAGMPVALVGLAVLLGSITSVEPIRYRGALHFMRIAGTVAIVVAGLFYYYPEMFAVYGAAAVAMVIGWLVLERRRLQLADLFPILIGLLIGTLSCLLFWDGTFGFLIYELNFAANVHVDWWKYFQAYLVNNPIANFVTSAIGLYFILPPNGLSAFVSTAWRAAAYLFTITVLIAVAIAWARAWSLERRPLLFLIGVLFALLVILITAISGQYWQAGEALAMIAPALFIVLVSPMLLPVTMWAPLRLAAISFACLYLAFGIVRPIAARNESGVHYAWPYPAAMDRQQKAKYDWDIQKYFTVLIGCNSTVLDLDDPFLERYVSIYLTDLGMKWTSTHHGDFHRPERTLADPIPKKADCIFTTGFVPRKTGRRIISLSRDHQLQDFMDGKISTVEIAVSAPGGVTVSGVYGIESYLQGRLRWTSEEAHFILPNDPNSPATRIRLLTWPVLGKLQRQMMVTVNGQTVYQGFVPVDTDPLSWNVRDRSSDRLDIGIKVEPHHVSNDPRDLGVALRSLVVSK